MQKYNDNEIELLSIQIGCTIKFERLKKGISQEELGLVIGSNSTMIGRIERYENSTNWQNLLKISQILEIDYDSLFKLKPIEEILLIIEGCIQLEKKLTVEKENYYSFLKKMIKEKFQNN